MTVKYQQGQEEHHGFLNSSRTDRIRQYKYHRNSIKETHNRRDVRNIKDSNNSTSISRDANSTAWALFFSFHGNWKKSPESQKICEEKHIKE